jgi:hypothetical protein
MHWRQVARTSRQTRLQISNLANGQTVIADCVDPVRESREGWQATATRARKRLIEVES